MLQPRDKILIYCRRTFSQRIEAVFDFMRLCRRAWFMLAAVLFLPVCVIFAVFDLFSYPTGEEASSEIDWMDGLFKWSSGPAAGFLVILALLGVWMMFVHAYSLQAAYRDKDFNLDDISLRELLPYVRAALLPSLAPMAMLGIVFFMFVMASSFIPLFLAMVLLTVPCSLFAPVYMIERRGWLAALKKALAMGFSSWVSLAFSIIMMVVFGYLMLLSINMPWILVSVTDVLSSSGDAWWYVMFLRFVGIVLSIVAYFSFYMVGAMVQQLCVYHYGNMAESNGDGASSENAINNFENL